MEAVQLEKQRVSRSRLSIADLILFTAVAGAALFFSQGMIPSLQREEPHQFLESRRLILLAIVSGLILLFSYGVVSGKTWKSRGVVIGVLFLLSFFLNFLSWHQFAWLILGIVVSVILGRVNRSHTFRLQLLVGWLFASTLSASLLNHYFPSSRVRNLLAAREAYPIEDLSSRLPAISRTSDASPDIANVKPSESRLNKELNPFYIVASDKNRRTSALRQIHDREYEGFVRSLGFGQFRMVSVSRRRIDLPKIIDINFNASEHKLKSEKYLLNPVFSDGERYEFDSELVSFQDLLKRSYLDFLNPSTLGWTAAPKNVAGFEPHAFRFPIPAVSIMSKDYSIHRLELIGLLMSDQPRVYVLDHLPRMDRISESDIPTRPLNEFESSALKKLIAGEDLVVDERSNQIKMVGALRSFESCASCHDSKSGDLLGAFSYELIENPTTD